MGGTSLGPRDKAEANRMMRSQGEKLIFPWPKNKNRRKYLKGEGFKAYKTKDNRKWKIIPQDEVNFEG